MGEGALLKMAEDGKSMRDEKYQNSWSKVKRMCSLMTCSCGRKKGEVEEKRKSLRESPRDKGGRGSRDRKLFLREAAVHLSQHTEKERKKKKQHLTRSPRLCFTTCGDWLLPARGIAHKLCKLFSFAQRSSHAN